MELDTPLPNAAGYREAIAALIREQALPIDKYGHQPRLYALTRQIAGASGFDDDVLFAAAWLHDLGVFIGHRPEDQAALERWDSLAYALQRAPAVLRSVNFPEQKIPAVVEAIRTHQPAFEPVTPEAVILRDADILEQLGAVGILRTVCKIGRDTRFSTFSHAVAYLRRMRVDLPARLRLDRARELAKPRLLAMDQFLNAAAAEAGEHLH